MFIMHLIINVCHIVDSSMFFHCICLQYTKGEVVHSFHSPTLHLLRQGEHCSEMTHLRTPAADAIGTTHLRTPAADAIGQTLVIFACLLASRPSMTEEQQLDPSQSN
jgi:hypothetical protein